METGAYNSWGDAVWKWPWSCLASQNNLAEVLLFKTGGRKRGCAGPFIKKATTIWGFLVMNL